MKSPGTKRPDLTVWRFRNLSTRALAALASAFSAPAKPPARSGLESGARRAPGGHRHSDLLERQRVHRQLPGVVAAGPEAVQQQAEEAAPERRVDVPAAVDDRPDHQLQERHVRDPDVGPQRALL